MSQITMGSMSQIWVVHMRQITMSSTYDQIIMGSTYESNYMSSTYESN